MVTSRGDSSAGDSLESPVPARRRAGSSAFRKTLRFAAITGVTGSAIFLFRVLGAQSANAATPDSTSAASQSASTNEGQGSGGLLGAIGNTLQGTVKVLENSVDSLLAPTPATPAAHEAKNFRAASGNCRHHGLLNTDGDPNTLANCAEHVDSSS